MSASQRTNGTDNRGRTKPTASKRRSGGQKNSSRQKDVSQILQSAYREALSEEVPSDMLDLLSKLD